MSMRTRPAITGTVFAGIAVLLALSLAAALFARAANPLFLDALGPAVAIFVLLPAALGALLGAVVGVLRGTVATKRAARPAAFLTVASILALVLLRIDSGHREMHPRHLVKGAVIGVDGATWTVIRPLEAAGRMPELARLEKDGASATCITLTPIFSSRIFTSIATGKVAEKHGIIGVSDTAERLRSARLWDILGARGWKTGTFEWYVTWPPEARTSGFTVPDIYARSNATAPTSLAFLRELRIDAKAGRSLGPRQASIYAVRLVRNGVRLSTFVEVARYGARSVFGNMTPAERYYRKQYLWVSAETDVFCRLIETYDLDFGALIYKITDSLGHMYWKYYEPSAFRNVPPDDVKRYADVIPGAYRLVDAGLGRIARRVSPDGVLAVISDHGFGPAPGAEAGLAAIQTGTLLATLGLNRAGWEYVNIGGAASLMLRNAATDEEHSRALQAVAARFDSARVRGSGEPVFIVEIQDRPGSGDDCLEIGIRHQLVTAMAADPGSADALVDFGGGTTLPLHDLFTTSELSGDHTLQGILVLRGKGVRKGASLPDCSVLDLAPTMLALRGLAVGEDMDGHVLVDALEPRWLAANPVRTIATWDSPATMPRLTRQDAGEIPPNVIKEMQSVGYLQGGTDSVKAPGSAPRKAPEGGR